MKALILAAGKGTRLEPLTEGMTKCMLPLAGRPILEHLVTILKEEGITSVAMVVGEGDDEIKVYFGNGSGFGIDIDYSVQEERLGTAHAISKVSFDEDFLVLNGDTIISSDSVRAVMDAHQGADATLGLITVENPKDYGIVQMEGDAVKEIVEKPAEPRSNLANAGVYAFSARVFEAIERTDMSERGEYEITDSIKILMEEGQVLGVELPGLWMDIGNPWNYLDANKAVLDASQSDIRGTMEEGVTLKGNLVLGEGSIIRSGTYIEGPVHVGENCVIGPNTFLRPHSAIGDYCKVGNGVEIKNTIIMDHTNIPHLSYMGDSIIGQNCNFGAGSKVGNLRLDDENVKMDLKGELVDSGRRKMGAVVGHNVKLGLDCLINAGRKIGSNSVLGPGVIVYRDIPADSRVFVKQDLI
jgi:bifunctional UDP-N-acetylglucosamine pyrophosphorylase/glucosamine-1-phosphate N-acetyltransferase